MEAPDAATESHPYRDSSDHGTPHERSPLGGVAASRSTRPVGALLALILLVNLSMSLYQLPLNRVIERRVCKQYYQGRIEGAPGSIFGRDGEVLERMCKISYVQEPLARLQLAIDLAWVSGDILMTIPLSVVAAKYGRRLVLLMNLVPRIAMLSWTVFVGRMEGVLPIQALAFAPALSLLGGDCVLLSIVYAYAASATGDNVVRASYFGYISSISYVVNLVGPALASATMTQSIWLPFLIGLGLLFLAAIVIFRIPDDVPSKPVTPTSSAHASDDDDSEAEDPDEAHRESLIGDARSKLSRRRHHGHNSSQLAEILADIRTRVRGLWSEVRSRPRNFSLILASMFLTSLASVDTKLLVPYISRRYGWTFASAGYLISGKGVVNFTLLTIVLPTLLKLRQARRTPAQHHSAEKTDVHDANVCLVLSVLGALFIGLAAEVWILVPAMFVYALGSALPVFTLSLTKSPQVSPTPASSAGLLPSHRKASSDGHGDDMTIFSIVMIVKTIGSLVGFPIVTGLWVGGMSLGGLALGLPYFVSSACYVGAIGLIRAMRVI